MAGIGSLFSLFGSIVGAAGQVAAAKEQQRVQEMVALQEEAKAKQREALATLEAEQERKKVNLARSQAQAISAASGFTSTDPVAILLKQDFAEEEYVRSGYARYTGAQERADLEYSADIRREQAQANVNAAKRAAFGSIIGGFASAFKGFGAGGSSISPTGYYR